MKKLLLSIMMGLSGSVWAAPSVDSLTFTPATDQGHYITVQESQTLGQGKFHLGLAFDYSDESLVLINNNGDKVLNVIDEQLAGHFTAAVGILDWLNLGALVNFVPYHNFTNPGSLLQDNGAQMGDIRLDAKIRIIDNQVRPLGLALVPFITLPTGSGSHFVGNGAITGGAELVLETPRINDRFSMSANVGAQVREGNNLGLIPSDDVDDQLLYGLAANYAINKKVEVIGELRGRTELDDLFADNQRPLTTRAAFRYFPRPDLALTAGGGLGVLDGIGSPKYETFVSVAYVPAYNHEPEPEPVPCPDADGDGVCDIDDRCPAEYGAASNCGCPENPRMEIDNEAKRILSQRILFAFDQAVIEEESMPIIETIAGSLRARRDITHVRIVGHTDGRGTNEYNQKLSERRAEAVYQALLQHGIAESRLTHFGKGESEPIASNQTDEGRAENRRVIFDIDVEPRAQPSACQRP